MRVTFEDVLNRAYTTLITDYKVDNLIRMDKQAFYAFFGGFLINSIDMFDGCLNDLSYHKEIVKDENGNNETIYVFDSDLTNKEVYILCLGVALGWYKKTLDDVTQYKLHLSTKDFKSFSESQNLQRRLDRLTVMEENFDKEICRYQLNNLDKISFFSGGE